MLPTAEVAGKMTWFFFKNIYGGGGHSLAWVRVLEDNAWGVHVMFSCQCVSSSSTFTQWASLKVTLNLFVFLIPGDGCALPFPVTQEHCTCARQIPPTTPLPRPATGLRKGQTSTRDFRFLNQELLFSPVWWLMPGILALGRQAGGSGPALVT